MINGTQASRHGLRVTHLFFADDSLLFAKANRRESERVKNVLQLYEECSGQKINFDKSTLFFSSNTSDQTKFELKELFRVKATMNLEKYLGLPTMVGKNKRYAFREIKSRISIRLKSWNRKTLSIGGKELLVKIVVQAILTYVMGYFLLLKSLCNEINSMICRYWWKHDRNMKRIHWKQMCMAKNAGGMIFRDMQLFNLALLGKQWWRLQHNTKSLMYDVMKVRYFPSVSFLEAELESNPSLIWRSI